MQNTNPKIYCAGPLFTTKEQEEMNELSQALEAEGYRTFLPQRDGLELTRCVDLLVDAGFPRSEAGHLMSRAIFALDIFQVLHECDALVANLNGRVPDEGTVSEAAMAWSQGKVVVGFKADMRTAFDGQDNPLVAGLFDFELCQTIEATVLTLENAIRDASYKDMPRERKQQITQYAKLGGEIATALERQISLEEIVNVIARFGHATVST